MTTKFVLCLLAIIGTMAKAESNEALQAVVAGTNTFDKNLYEVLSKKNEDNLICSPLSAATVLSMAAYGADGNTAVQMRQALGLPADEQLGKTGFRNLIDTLNNVEGVELRVANGIYVGQGFPVKPDYTALTSEFFRSVSKNLDFSKPTEAAATVNQWCADHTNNKITELLSPADIDPNTKMVLLNAVYFKGKWVTPFNPKLTIDRPFHISSSVTKDVPTMYVKAHFRYGRDADLKASFIELPYEGYNVSMLIILPDAIDGLAEVEQALKGKQLNEILDKVYSQEVMLYLPKFKIESTIPLNDALQQLGMTDMFTGAANFSNIADSPLAISSVLQKAYIEVNEEGSEAAAVTGIAVGYSSMVREHIPITFNVDHAFSYHIIERSQETVLFKGHVISPRIS